MEQLNKADAILSKTIFLYPDLVLKELNKDGVFLSKKPTLQEITSKTFKSVYGGNERLERAIFGIYNSDGKSEVAGAIIGMGASLISGIIGSSQAKKNRELQRKIAVANLEQQKLISDQQLQLQGETDRVKILANTLLSYRQSLQTESTERQKNVYLYLIAIGLGISTMYGTYLLFNNS